MKRTSRLAIAGLLSLVLASPMLRATDTTAPRERVSLNTDWRFHNGDPAWVQPSFNYTTVRAWILPSSAPLLGAGTAKPSRPAGSLGSDIAAVQPGFDDSAWRALDLPHDWAIEGPFRQDLPGETGKLPFANPGWYRKKFTLPASDTGRRLTLEIDGAMSSPLVWLNGEFVGGWAYGYTSFQLDLTPYAKPGAENVLVVRLENHPESSRWYPGAGLYRNVWLTKTGPIHVAQWGTFVTTPKVTAESALISVEVRTVNDTPAAADLTLDSEIFALDAAGKKSAAAVTTGQPVKLHAPARREASTTQTLKVSAPKLWSPASPARYVAVTTIKRGDEIVDRVETPFGIRTIAFDADRGFLLNGEVVRIQGVCLHHDLGALGTAINVRAIERQLEILRSMGCNAIRTSHNPPAPELLDACDRLGFLVQDEAFDCWAKGKGRNDYHRFFPDWHEADLRALVRRDRNHPSVIMWSIGNEVVEQWGDDSTEAWKLATRLAGIVREEDRTRPVTNANHGGNMGFNGVQLATDILGYNYRIETYAAFRAANPAIPLYGSETASTISSRGEYFFPLSEDKLDPNARANFQVSSYDYTAESWASGTEPEWRAADAITGYAGEFVWTGFDYLGEPQPYTNDATVLLNFSNPEAREKMAKQLAERGRIPVPSRSSYFGILDLAGLPKDRFYLYQARWRPEHPMAHLLPHWTWPERVGEITPVHVYTSGDEAELFLNGQSLGRKKRGPQDYRLRWDDVRYAPGEIKVIAYKNGQRWAEDVQRTAGAPAKIALTPDRASFRADGLDLVYVTVDIQDAGGVLAPRANNQVRFTLQGPGDIIATDNGDATSFESFQAPQRKAYNGRAVVIIRSRAGQAGPLALRAESDGLAPQEITLTSALR
ncbi:MAG TPA: beta-galactosidase GalB [Opitutaceae bacterium]|nr:beta-galactosidase GalB [Opitutaceae bacterium]